MYAHLLSLRPRPQCRAWQRALESASRQERQSWKERSRNMQSAEEQEELVEAYIDAEQAQGRIILAGTPTGF